MAVYPPQNPSPQTPQRQCQADATQSETSEMQPGQLQWLETSQDEKERKKKRPKWVRRLFGNERSEEKVNKRSIMGRFRSLFKSDKEKAPGSPNPNPYSPQQSPTPSYDSNPYASGPQGLPPGPPSGGLSSGYGQGSPLPSPYSQDSAPPAYDARSPSNISAYSANQATDFKYPREKFGAADGIGKDRFGGSPASQHGRFAAPPSQRQGGYGGLDSQNESLFANYSGPPKQATSPSFSQTSGPGGPVGPDGYPEEREMTEQEREDAEVERTKEEIRNYLVSDVDLVHRIKGNLINAHQIQDRNDAMIDDQGRRINRTHENIVMAGSSAAQAGKAVDETDKSSRWLGGFGEKTRDANRERSNQMVMRAGQARVQEEQERQANFFANTPQPPRTLGASSSTDEAIKKRRFDFEAFDGGDSSMADMDEEIERTLQYDVLPLAQELGFRAGIQSRKLESQNITLEKTLEETELTQHGVYRGQQKLDGLLRK